MNRPSLPPAGFLLPMCVAGIGAFLLLPEMAVDRTPSPLTQQRAAAPRQGNDSANLPPLSDLASALAAFADRPLLAEGRRLPEQPVIEPAAEPPTAPDLAQEPISPPPPDPPRLQAAGIITIGGQSRVLLRNLDDGTEIWASEGDRLDNWTLVEITQVGALLEASGVQVTIMLFEEPLP